MGKVRCHVCKKKCEGSVLKIQGDKYIHRHCFYCQTCRVSLENGGYFKKEEKFYCRKHYLENYGVRCSKCQKIAEGEVIIFLGSAFHFDCFQCSKCAVVLKRGEKVAQWCNEYLCQTCFIKQNFPNGGVIEDKVLVSQMEKGEAETKQKTKEDIIVQTEQPPDEMCTSMASTYLSETSDTEQQTTPCRVIKKQNGVIRDNEVVSDSECRSTQTEDLKKYNELYFYGKKYVLEKEKASNTLKQRRSRSYLEINKDYKRDVPSRAQYVRKALAPVVYQPQPQHFHIPREKARSLPRSPLSPGKTMNSETYKYFMQGFRSEKEENEAEAKKLGTNTMPENISSTETLDPIRSSRSPGADFEPSVELRLKQHNFVCMRLSSSSLPVSANCSQLPKQRLAPSVTVSPTPKSPASKPSHISINPLTSLRRTSSYMNGTSFYSNYSSEYYNPKDFLKKTSSARCSSLNTLAFKVIPYSELSSSDIRSRKGLDFYRLEIYLNEAEFQSCFKMSRQAFYHLPEWKQNDLKRRVKLY